MNTNKIKPTYTPGQHIQWIGNDHTGYLRLLDQTRLPLESVYIDCKSVQQVWDAIKILAIRGAPAIGIAAAYACVIGAQSHTDPKTGLQQAISHLQTCRPTAINLFYALKRMDECAKNNTPDVPLLDTLYNEAIQIHQDDIISCNKIAIHGFDLLQQLTNNNLHLLTHCNAGSLATGGIGTATAPMYEAHKHNIPLSVYADETRPLLQGSRLTAWELLQAGINVTIITDSMAAKLMNDGKIKAVITGSDRIVANGDVANKIGTYSLAVNAKYHNIPFVVAAPTTTFDTTITHGSQIPIEERDPTEVTMIRDTQIAPDNVHAASYAFDVTPAELVTAIITEKGIIQPVNTTTIQSHLYPIAS